MTEKLSFEEQADRAYSYMCERMDAEIQKQDEEILRQERLRSEMRQRHKQRMQKRLELQQKCGQMITTTSQLLASSQVTDTTALPAVTRRAIRNGEFLPHCKHCCISSKNHSMCKIPTEIVKDAIAMTENRCAAPTFVPPQKRFQTNKQNIDYSQRKVNALNYFKDAAAVQEQLYEPPLPPRNYQPNPRNVSDVLAGGPLRADFLAHLFTGSYRPCELARLVEQEKAEGVGEQAVKEKCFTMSEKFEGIPGYTGRLDTFDKTRPPGATEEAPWSPGHSLTRSLGAGLATGPTAKEIPDAITQPSLPQLLVSAALVNKQDRDGLQAVHTAPEAIARTTTKRVAFAADWQLIKGSAECGNDSNDSIGANDVNDEDSRGFPSDPESPRASEKENCNLQSSQAMIQWFEAKHGLK